MLVGSEKVLPGEGPFEGAQGLGIDGLVAEVVPVYNRLHEEGVLVQLNIRHFSSQSSMSARPRPVTATVTKPPWMQVPEADAAMYRRHSLTSNGSTASLTSVLDHDSYVSEPDQEEVKGDSTFDQQLPNSMGDAQSKVHFDERPLLGRKVKRHKVDSVDNLRRAASAESGLSAWEIWLIQKAKEERKLRQQVMQKKKEEKQARLAKEREKQLKEQKATEVRHEWLQMKKTEEKIKKKMDKLKIQHEKQVKEENEERIRRKAEVFREWKETKQREEKERHQREKEKQQKELEAKQSRQEQANQKYQEWLKRNKKRPQSAPPKQVTGYNNNAAYPKPGYINPVPWQHPAIPKVKSEKPKKSRPKRYVWNPDKYF